MNTSRLRLSVVKFFITLVVLSSPAILAEKGEERSRDCLRGDCLNGPGILEIKTSLGTNTYIGNFKEGKYHGFGKLTEMVLVNARSYYAGNWDDGIRNGRGTFWNGINDLYIGQWKDGLRHGKGSYFFGLTDWSENQHTEFWLAENTENYTGDFENDLYHGNGTFRWPDGQKYIGGFFANNKHGAGTFYYPRGTIRPQIWEYGDFVR